jgi:hypothetical protein
MLNSSSRVTCATLLLDALTLAVLASVALAGCSVGAGGGSSSTAIECTAAGKPVSKVNAGRVTALRRTIESSPLYLTASRAASPAECHVQTQGSRLELDYRFRDGSRLHVARDDSIEFSEQLLEVASAMTEDSLILLRRAERASFGDKGCGIEWQSPNTQKPAANAVRSEDVFYGEICNCQARVGRDATKRVIALTLRSAC